MQDFRCKTVYKREAVFAKLLASMNLQKHLFLIAFIIAIIVCPSLQHDGRDEEQDQEAGLNPWKDQEKGLNPGKDQEKGLNCLPELKPPGSPPLSTCPPPSPPPLSNCDLETDLNFPLKHDENTNKE